MPLDDSLRSIPRNQSLQPSAAIELTWLVADCGETHAKFLTPYPALAKRVATFWGDGTGLLFEPMICAQQLGCLFGWDIEPLFHLERYTLTVPPDLTLETELAEDRALLTSRMVKLAGDAALRKRFSRLLREVWAEATPAWNDLGRGAIERATTRLQASLDHGVSPMDLTPPNHCARRDVFSGITQRAASNGTLVVTPCYFAGQRGHIIALPGVLSISVGAGVTDDMARRRVDAERVAGGLKLLSDPTRLLILNELDREPMTVGETAKCVGVAQPTASVHLRQLREAGLLETQRDGSRTVFRVRRERVRQLIDDARGTILESGTATAA